MVSLTAALFSNNGISNNSNNLALAQAALSSGHRITQASQDVAALAVGTALNTQVTTLRASLSNASQASSLLQVANGGLDQQLDILQQQKAIAVQAASGGIDDTTRAQLDQQFQGLSQQLDQIAGSTNFNGVPLLNGSTNTASTLVTTNAQATAYAPTTATSSNGSTAANSSFAIQAFNSQTGAAASAGTNGGDLQVTDAGGNVLNNAAYGSVDSTLGGHISNFTLSNVNYGTSATITATVGGVHYSGTYAAGATSAVLSNGNTNILITTGTTAGAATPLDISDSAAVANSQAGLNNVFANTQVQRVQTVDNVDFSGTSLAGAVGGASSIATARLDEDKAVISNFQYAGNNGTANSNMLSVQVNGQTFTATGVSDIVGGANSTILFQSADNQTLKIDLSGAALSGNIRTDSTAQANFVSALNSGFAKAGGGQSFTLGASGTDSLSIALGSTTTNALFNGRSLTVGTQSQAAAAADAIDQAINSLSSAQANVGALQSQVDASGANLSSSLLSQESASSSLLDTDVAAESTTDAAANILLQASIASHAQGNRLHSNLLTLLT
jgi:flagellin